MYVFVLSAFRPRAGCVVVIAFAKSLVLSTFARLTVAVESPPLVPENVGLLIGAC